MKFWDREKEAIFLRRYIESEPNAILFVYGPKSSGKSTLLGKVIEDIREEKKALFFDKYQIYWFDLRGKFIPNYESVIDMFFVDEDTEVMKKVRKKRTEFTFLKFFTVGSEVYKEIRQRQYDPFEYMEEEIKESGKKTVIVFDEIQRLKRVYLNSPNNQREVINELFNFFVRLTKVKHLSHVLVMTSDTFFIEEIYQSSALENTSRYFLVDFFDDETTYKILKDEGLSDEEARYVVENVGGVPWMMEQILNGDVKDTVDELYRVVKNSVEEKLGDMYEESSELQREAFALLRKIISGEGVEMRGKDRKMVKLLVEKEILYYDPINDRITPHTKLHGRAIRKILEELK